MILTKEIIGQLLISVDYYIEEYDEEKIDLEEFKEVRKLLESDKQLELREI